MTEFVLISEKNRERYLRLVAPIGNLLARLGVHPHCLTVTGFILSIVAGLTYSTGYFFWAAWVVVLAGTCDVLDGQIAKQTNKNSIFGAFFDSTLDRYSDMFLFTGLAYYFAGGKPFTLYGDMDFSGHTSPWTVFVIIMAIAGSFMVSYTRARAEGLGIECKVGLMQRPERIILLIIGSLLGPIPKIGPILLKFTLLLIAVSSNLTAFYRMFYVRNQILRENQVR